MYLTYTFEKYEIDFIVWSYVLFVVQLTAIIKIICFYLFFILKSEIIKLMKDQMGYI